MVIFAKVIAEHSFFASKVVATIITTLKNKTNHGY